MLSVFICMKLQSIYRGGIKMVFVKINSENRIEFIHHRPFDEKSGLGKTEEELRNMGVLVDSIPQPDTSDPDKIGILKYDGTKLYYEYINRPLSQEEKTEQSLKEVKSLKSQNAEIILSLTLGGLM